MEFFNTINLNRPFALAIANVRFVSNPALTHPEIITRPGCRDASPNPQDRAGWPWTARVAHRHPPAWPRPLAPLFRRSYRRPRFHITQAATQATTRQRTSKAIHPTGTTT
jgi:hypothetical protein